MNEEIFMYIDKNTNPKDLYKFISENLPFNSVMELYKMLNRRLEDLEDDNEFILEVEE